jgi:hypothetical protein
MGMAVARVLRRHQSLVDTVIARNIVDAVGVRRMGP